MNRGSVHFSNTVSIFRIILSAHELRLRSCTRVPSNRKARREYGFSFKLPRLYLAKAFNS